MFAIQGQSWGKIYSRLLPYGHLTIATRGPVKRIKKWLNQTSVSTTDWGYYWGADTFICHPAKYFTCLFSRYRGHLNTSSKILTHIMQSDTTIKENTETILQLAANMRISCLRPNLYPVRGATRETLCLRSHILFHMFRDQITYFLCYYPAITDSRNYEHKISPRGFCNNGSRV